METRDLIIDNMAPLIDSPILLKKVIDYVNQFQLEHPELKVTGCKYEIKEGKLDFIVQCKGQVDIPDVTFRKD